MEGQAQKPTGRYSRLDALGRMGVVQNWTRLQQQTIAIIGIGGVGSVAAEMLTRCGTGTLHLYDFDTVEEANMNRLFFRPDQIGQAKTDAAVSTLSQINPQCTLVPHNTNITEVQHFNDFLDTLRTIDLLLCCVDNYAARVSVNKACLLSDCVWIESGVSEDAMSGHIQLMYPGESACFECAPPMALIEDNEADIKRELVCAASLPTTMSITAGFLVQNALKHLLQFGSVAKFVGYQSLHEHFTQYEMRPNPECRNQRCLELQAEFQAGRASRVYEPPVIERQQVVPVASSELNQWGISLAAETPPSTGPGETGFTTNEASQQSAMTSGMQTMGLEELRARLASAQTKQ